MIVGRDCQSSRSEKPSMNNVVMNERGLDSENQIEIVHRARIPIRPAEQAREEILRIDQRLGGAQLRIAAARAGHARSGAADHPCIKPFAKKRVHLSLWTSKCGLCSTHLTLYTSSDDK